MTHPLQDQADADNGKHSTLMDTRSFILVVAAVATGVLLYANPPVGMAVLGAITVLAALAGLVRR